MHAGFDCEDLLAETGHSDPALVFAVEAAYLPACDYVSAASTAMAARLQQQYRTPDTTVLYNVFPSEMARQLKPPDQRPGAAAPRLHWSGQTAGPGKGLEEAFEAAQLVEQVMPIAREMGVESSVTGWPERVAHLDALQIALDSDAVVVIGSDAPHYTVSKVFPYILSEKPGWPAFEAYTTRAMSRRLAEAFERVPWQNQQRCPNPPLPGVE